MSAYNIKIVAVPKSKMQAIREYTHLRAFAELGADGSPIGYFIEQQGVTGQQQHEYEQRQNGEDPPKKRITRTRHGTPIYAHRLLFWTGNRAVEEKEKGSAIRRTAEIFAEHATQPTVRREIEDFAAEQLELDRATVVMPAVSVLIKEGFIGVVDPHPTATTDFKQGEDIRKLGSRAVRNATQRRANGGG